MPTITDVAQIVLGAAGGMGAGSLLRAWGQNRNEQNATITTEQQQFRDSQRQAIQDLEGRNEYLRGRLDAIDLRNADLVQINAQLAAKVEIYEAQIERFADQLTVSFAERERLSQRVKDLDTKVKAQEIEITTLR